MLGKAIMGIFCGLFLGMLGGVGIWRLLVLFRCMIISTVSNSGH